MSWERHGGLRAAITQLAAQIMYGEDVKQYFTAKRLAAKRLLGRAAAGKTIRYRPRDLPSNGEIKKAPLAAGEEAADRQTGEKRHKTRFPPAPSINDKTHRAIVSVASCRQMRSAREKVHHR
jgi:hypothetical protein